MHFAQSHMQPCMRLYQFHHRNWNLLKRLVLVHGNSFPWRTLCCLMKWFPYLLILVNLVTTRLEYHLSAVRAFWRYMSFSITSMAYDCSFCLVLLLLFTRYISSVCTPSLNPVVGKILPFSFRTACLCFDDAYVSIIDCFRNMISSFDIVIIVELLSQWLIFIT